ncbi:MAG: hypothetical protein JSR86_16915 [Proteobacteria bacterium]|nr:hypothetical protein [Pseudomonadota bacterium]
MSTRTLQYGLGAVFIVLGGWCVVAPASVLALCFRPEFQTTAPIAPILAGGFGSQALISGLFAMFSRFTRATFAAYAVGLMPFLAFDGWFRFVTPALSDLGFAADLAGNLIMLTVCWLGWRGADRA